MSSRPLRNVSDCSGQRLQRLQRAESRNAGVGESDVGPLPGPTPAHPGGHKLPGPAECPRLHNITFEDCWIRLAPLKQLPPSWNASQSETASSSALTTSRFSETSWRIAGAPAPPPCQFPPSC